MVFFRDLHVVKTFKYRESLRTPGVSTARLFYTSAPKIQTTEGSGMCPGAFPSPAGNRVLCRLNPAQRASVLVICLESRLDPGAQRRRSGKGTDRNAR